MNWIWGYCMSLKQYWRCSWSSSVERCGFSNAVHTIGVSPAYLVLKLMLVYGLNSYNKLFTFAMTNSRNKLNRIANMPISSNTIYGSIRIDINIFYSAPLQILSSAALKSTTLNCSAVSPPTLSTSVRPICLHHSDLCLFCCSWFRVTQPKLAQDTIAATLRFTVLGIRFRQGSLFNICHLSNYLYGNFIALRSVMADISKGSDPRINNSKECLIIPHRFKGYCSVLRVTVLRRKIVGIRGVCASLRRNGKNEKCICNLPNLLTG